MRRARALAACAVALLAATARVAPAQAGAPDDPPLVGHPRPRLPRDLDARDPQTYINCAVDAKYLDEANACVHWATRLAPERAEPYYLRYEVSDHKDSAALRQAWLRDPFLYESRFVGGIGRSGIFSTVRGRAWAYLRGSDYSRAAVAFSRHLAGSPGDLEARYGAAIAAHYLGRHDSAVVHLRALADGVRELQAARTMRMLPGNLLDYAMARSWIAAGRPDPARAALERALGDDVALYQARELLADLALARGDTAEAAAHWAQVREVAGSDPLARAHHARFLIATGRAGDAAVLLEGVLVDEPYWLAARRDLALALEALGPTRRADAVAAWRSYLAWVPRLPVEPRADAERRLARLTAPD